ncbi:ribonuclease 3-like protein 2 [Capsicum annuum]
MQSAKNCSTMTDAIKFLPSPAEEETTKMAMRLAFIGDAALSLAILSYFFVTYPEIDHGKLTDLRAVNVSTEKLARVVSDTGSTTTSAAIRQSSMKSTEKLSKVVVRHGLYNYLRRDSAIFDEKVKEFMIAVQQEKEMEFHGGMIKAPKVLTDIMESVMGPVFLDCGFDVNAFWVVSFFLTI